MAYMLTCYGGFQIPAKKGRFTVVGISAAVNDSTTDSEFAIVDDEAIRETWFGGRNLASINANTKNVIVDLKGDGSAYDSYLEWTAPEPIKTRYGISILATNLKPGTLCVYVK